MSSLSRENAGRSLAPVLPLDRNTARESAVNAGCEHVRAALVSSGGAISGVSSRSELRSGVGDVRWCTECGAIQGVVGGRVSPWMVPGSDDAARALETLRKHEQHGDLVERDGRRATGQTFDVNAGEPLERSRRRAATDGGVK